MLTADLVPKTHSGVVTLLHKHFVQDDTFDFAQASFFSRLMPQRIEDDYSDFLILSEEEVVIFIEPAKVYVAYVSAKIERYLSTAS